MTRKIGIGHNRPPADRAPPFHIDPVDLVAAKAAAKQLPPNFSLDDVERAAKQRFANHRQARRRAREQRREGLKNLFEIYVSIADDSKQQERLKSACILDDITVKANTHLAVVVIKCYWDDRLKREGKSLC